ncbi:MAG: type II secretion system F family protein [Candidatus Latescibacteria bacterium]|jgi:type IV pilus assembly protein PilC|nr:type II secretion system F family protein [Candidatus Latescibacterota bacterium]
MPIFTYEGKTSAGKNIKGEYTAENRDEIFKYLRSKGILATKVKRKAKSISLKFGTGINTEDVTNFARQFASMISAGLPLVQCLNILSEQTENPNFKERLTAVTAGVETGNSLADSLGKHPDVFPELFINMIAAGEIGGILDTILLRLATFLEKAAALKRKIKGVMMYPLVISVVLVLAVAALLIFVIPVFSNMFAEFGADLPAMTQIVVNMSNFLKTPSKILPLIGIAVFLGFAFKKYQSTKEGRYNIDKLILKIPVLGDLAKKSSVAQFSRTLGTLLSSGVSILEALEITGKTASNMVVRRALLSMIAAISEGKTITEPMKATGVFPPMVIQMVAVGEESGGLDQMLTKIADFYDEEVNAAVETLTSIMEPIIIVILAVVMGATLIAMYLPMFDMISAVGG